MFVDRTVGAEAQFSSAKIKVCFASPYIPPPLGAPSGASLLVAAFSMQGVFRNPSRSGSYPWNAVFTPFSPGTGTLNPANAAQSTSYARLPVALTLKATKRGRRTSPESQPASPRPAAEFVASGSTSWQAGQPARSGASAVRGRTRAAARPNSSVCATG